MSSTPSEIGGYRIERELGRGGMGVVYLAHDPRLGRRVALKVLLDPATDPDAMKRFLVEARASAKLQHPGIVALHQVGSEGRNAYLVLDFVEGEGLDARLARTGPLPPSLAASIVAGVAEAIEHAHGRGILHRDLKPANVLLDPAGRPRVTDFGLARETSAERERLTRTGEVLGTPSYMAPEQALGTGEVTPAADVYALGALLYEVLTGAPPFPGSSVLAVLERVVSEVPTAPSQVRPGLPVALDRIALRALEKEPRKRYPSAAALAEDLRRFEAGDAVTAPRQRWWPGALVLAAVGLSAAAVGSRWPGSPSEETAAPPSPPEPPAATGTPAASPGSLPRRSGAEVRFGAPPTPSAKVHASLRPIPPSPAYRYLRLRLDIGRRYRMGLLGGGRWIVAARDRRDPLRGLDEEMPPAVVYDVWTWKTVERWEAAPMARSFDTAGRYLARVARTSPGVNGLQVLECDFEAGAVSVLARWPCATTVTAVAVAPDGSAVATGDQGGVVRVYSTRAPRSAPSAYRHHAAISALAFDPGGGRVLVGLDPKKPTQLQDHPPPEENLWVWVVTNLTSPAGFFPPFDRVNQIAFAPGGRTIALGTGVGGAYRFHRDRAGRLSQGNGWQGKLRDTVGKASPVSGVAFDPAGARLLITGRSARQVVTWKLRRAWKDPHRVTLDYEPLGVAFTADDQLVIVGSTGSRRQLRGLLEVWSRTPVD